MIFNRILSFYIPLASSLYLTTVESYILCPGFDEEDYCDCTGDCFQNPTWCSCKEAYQCCVNASYTDITEIFNASYHDTEAMIFSSKINSVFEIYTLAEAKEKCKLHDSVEKSLKKQGFVKVMCPFGILLLAVNNYPNELLKFGANIVANLVDINKTGYPSNEKVINELAHNGKKNHGNALVCGTSYEEERREENLKGLDYTFSCQTWKGYDESDYKSIMFEEAFHLVHQGGWAKVNPDEFGLQNFEDSVICRETARLQCVKPGWWHPENKCPNGAPFQSGFPAPSPLSPGEGDCTYASCDCAEFYRQAATLYMGWDSLPFWYSPYMPQNRTSFLKMASQELLNVMVDPRYNQPQEPFNGEYTANVTFYISSGSIQKNNFYFLIFYFIFTFLLIF